MGQRHRAYLDEQESSSNQMLEIRNQSENQEQERLSIIENNQFHKGEVIALMLDMDEYVKEGNVDMYNSTLEQVKRDIDQMNCI